MRVKLALIVLGLTLFVTSISSVPAQTKFKPTEVRTTLFPYNQEWGRLQNKISFSSDSQRITVDRSLKREFQWRDVKTLQVNQKLEFKKTSSSPLFSNVHIFSNSNRILALGGDGNQVLEWRMTDQDGNVLWDKPSPGKRASFEVDAVEQNIYVDNQVFDLEGNEVPYVGMSDGEVYDKILKLYDDSWKDKSNDFRINYGYIIKSNYNANRFIYSKDERYFFDDFSIFYYNASKNKLRFVIGGRNKLEYDAYWKKYKISPCYLGVSVDQNGPIVSQCLDKNNFHKLLTWKNGEPKNLISAGRTWNFSTIEVSSNSKYFAMITDVLCGSKSTSTKPIKCGNGVDRIGNLRVYDAKTYKVIAKFPHAKFENYRLTFSPDGKKIAYLGLINDNITLHVWTLEP
jgi:hypothetical protein